MGALGSKIFAQDKKKNILYKKKTSELVKQDGELVDKKETKFFLEIQVSTQCCTICNTSKI